MIEEKSGSVKRKLKLGRLTRDVLHDQVECVGVLEGEEEFHDPFAIRFGEDVSLRLHVGQLPATNNVSLLEDLHGVELAILLFANQPHPTECTHT